MKNTVYTSHDGKEIALYTWDEVKEPKGVVKIAHGMAEHSARYDEFAQFLNSNGYIVVMNDHRGHGLTAEADSLGYEEGDMWTKNVQDRGCATQVLQGEVLFARDNDGAQLRQFHYSGCNGRTPRRRCFCTVRVKFHERTFLHGVQDYFR